MPTCVSDLLSNVGLEVMGQVKWGEKIGRNQEGIYIVAITHDPNKIVCLEDSPISNQKVNEWINAVNTLRLDRERPTSTKLSTRLSEFWLPDETILYIGKASRSINKRVNQYYRTRLGQKSPHAGGHWLKILSILNDLNVYWCECSNSNEMEDKLLNNFMKRVSKSTLSILSDPEHPFPFANLEYPKGTRKSHGIKGAVNRNT
jgi:hypothetical protein